MHRDGPWGQAASHMHTRLCIGHPLCVRVLPVRLGSGGAARGCFLLQSGLRARTTRSRNDLFHGERPLGCFPRRPNSGTGWPPCFIRHPEQTCPCRAASRKRSRGGRLPFGIKAMLLPVLTVKSWDVDPRDICGAHGHHRLGSVSSVTCGQGPVRGVTELPGRGDMVDPAPHHSPVQKPGCGAPKGHLGIVTAPSRRMGPSAE